MTKSTELQIGDVCYYQATKEDINNTYEYINNEGTGWVNGGFDGDYYGVTPLGNYFTQILEMMEKSICNKLKVEIINLDPIRVNPLLLFERGIEKGDLFYFPKFVIGRLYNQSDKLIDFE